MATHSRVHLGRRLVGDGAVGASVGHTLVATMGQILSSWRTRRSSPASRSEQGEVAGGRPDARGDGGRHRRRGSTSISRISSRTVRPPAWTVTVSPGPVPPEAWPSVSSGVNTTVIGFTPAARSRCRPCRAGRGRSCLASGRTTRPDPQVAHRGASVGLADESGGAGRRRRRRRPCWWWRPRRSSIQPARVSRPAEKDAPLVGRDRRGRRGRRRRRGCGGDGPCLGRRVRRFCQRAVTLMVGRAGAGSGAARPGTRRAAMALGSGIDADELGEDGGDVAGMDVVRGDVVGRNRGGGLGVGVAAPAARRCRRRRRPSSMSPSGSTSRFECVAGPGATRRGRGRSSRRAQLSVGEDAAGGGVGGQRHLPRVRRR